MVHTNTINRRRHEKNMAAKINLDSDFTYIFVGSASKNGRCKVKGGLRPFFI